MRQHVRDAVIVGLSFVAGLGVPDLDQILPLGHRSALTHSVVPVLLALLHPERGLAAGLALGIGVHLSADSFPNAMTGYATVKLPFAGSIGASASYVWLGANALLSLLLGSVLSLRVLPRPIGIAILAAIAAGSAVYLFVTDGGWPALALFGGVSALAWRQSRKEPPA